MACSHTPKRAEVRAWRGLEDSVLLESWSLFLVFEHSSELSQKNEISVK